MTPTKRGGGTFSHVEGGGGTNSFEVVLTQELEVFSHRHSDRGGLKKFPPFKRGDTQTVVPCLGGGGHKKFRTCDFPIL